MDDQYDDHDDPNENDECQDGAHLDVIYQILLLELVCGSLDMAYQILSVILEGRMNENHVIGHDQRSHTINHDHSHLEKIRVEDG